MISYQQRSTLLVGRPKVFGEHPMFARTLGLPATKPDDFKLRVVSGRLAGLGERENFVVLPDAALDGLAELNGSGVDLQVGADNGSIDQRDVLFPVENSIKWIYGHWLVDILPRAMVACNLLKGMRVRLLYSEPMPEFAFQLAEVFGFARADFLSLDQVERSEPHAFVLMSHMRQYDYFNASLMAPHFRNEVWALMKAVEPATGGDRLYVSRGNWKPLETNSRSLLNRNEVEMLFERAGFRLVHPETMSIAQQIAMFAGAEVIAGESGSGLHNSVFMRPRTHVICIQSARQDHLIQGTICELFDQTSAYVVGEPESSDWESNHFAQLEDVQRAIADCDR